MHTNDLRHELTITFFIITFVDARLKNMLTACSRRDAATCMVPKNETSWITEIVCAPE